MTYLGQALVAIVTIVTAAIAIVWMTKTIYTFIVKSRKEAIKPFEEPLKGLLDMCVKSSSVLFKMVTKEVDKIEKEDND